MLRTEWNGFKSGEWVTEVNMREFIKKNYTPYDGDDSFLNTATPKTEKLWQKVLDLMKEENEKGILDAETQIPSSITSHEPGYIDKDLEEIVGLQTDKPFKRGIFPNGGLRVVKQALQSYGYELDPKAEKIYSNFRKTHNDGVFDSYTQDIFRARKSGIITGLPDAYGRGRIIGDDRRVA
jgi:formate C-acetyltransferase